MVPKLHPTAEKITTTAETIPFSEGEDFSALIAELAPEPGLEAIYLVTPSPELGYDVLDFNLVHAYQPEEYNRDVVIAATRKARAENGPRGMLPRVVIASTIDDRDRRCTIRQLTIGTNMTESPRIVTTWYDGKATTRQGGSVAEPGVEFQFHNIDERIAKFLGYYGYSEGPTNGFTAFDNEDLIWKALTVEIKQSDTRAPKTFHYEQYRSYESRSNPTPFPSPKSIDTYIFQLLRTGSSSQCDLPIPISSMPMQYPN